MKVCKSQSVGDGVAIPATHNNRHQTKHKDQNGKISAGSSGISTILSPTTSVHLNGPSSPGCSVKTLSLAVTTADVLLSNVHLVSASPSTPSVLSSSAVSTAGTGAGSTLIWPAAEGFLRQALMNHSKGQGGGGEIREEAGGVNDHHNSQSVTPTLLAVTMAPQGATPLFTTASIPSHHQVIMVGEINGTPNHQSNHQQQQIILTTAPGPIPTSTGGGGLGLVGLGEHHSHNGSVSDLLVIDEHNSFANITLPTTTSPTSSTAPTTVTNNRGSNSLQVKACFSLFHKLFSTSHNGWIVNENESDKNSSSASTNTPSTFDGQTDLSRLIQVDHNSSSSVTPGDGSGGAGGGGGVELGYTVAAHLLSQLSGTGTLPTMSSSQVSSVLSALDLPIHKTGCLEKSSSSPENCCSSDLRPPSPSPSPEFVKIESNSLSFDVTTKTDSASSNPRCKVIELNRSETGSGDNVVKGTLFSCTSCGYLTIKESAMENHHRQSICMSSSSITSCKCPGCNSFFKSKQSLQVHLIEDHHVCTSEVAFIVAAATCNTTSSTTIPTANTCGDSILTRHNKSPLEVEQMEDGVLQSVDSDKDSLVYTTTTSTTTNSSNKRPRTTSTSPVNLPVLQLIGSPHTDPTPPPSCSSPSSPPVSLITPTHTPITIPSSPPTINHPPSPISSSSAFDQVFSANHEPASSTPPPNQFADEDLLKTSTGDKVIGDDVKNENIVLERDNENQSKKRGRPQGAPTLRLVRAKYKSSEIKLEKDLGFKCGTDGCAVRLENEVNMIYHKQCHCPPPTSSSPLGIHFKCPECPHFSTQWSNLTTHLWKAHSIDMELYSCNQCGYKTNSHSMLVNLHSRIHENERPFLCDLCGKGFKTPKQLRNHKTIHKGKGTESDGESSSISCNICGRKVSDLRNLRHHTEHVHNKRKPYLCSFCGYAAASTSSLRMHSRQHTGEKPYGCEECTYTTADHNSLRRHKMRHSGNKPYQCPHCPYACIQSTTYKAHLKNKHPGLDEGLMFSCPVCPFRSVKRDNFLAHTAQHNIHNAPGTAVDTTQQMKQRKVNNTSSNLTTTTSSHKPTSITSTPSVENRPTTTVTNSTTIPIQSLVKQVSIPLATNTSSKTTGLSHHNQHQNQRLHSNHPTSDMGVSIPMPVGVGVDSGGIILANGDPLSHSNDNHTQPINEEFIVPESADVHR